MNSICRQFGRILAIFLVSFLATATVLAFTPSSTLAFFHEVTKKSESKPAPSAKPTLSPKSTVKPKVRGAKDNKGDKGNKGESAIGKFFKSIGRGLAAIGDFLWPFDGKTAKKEVKTGQAKASPASSPSPVAEQPKELAPTGEETATETGSVTVAVPDTITNDTLTILGNLTWGDSTADRLTLKGLLASDILLDKSKTYTLANSGERFKAGYFSDNVYIGDENRIGATGMNTKGSMYLETRSSGSIYLNPDSDNVYVGTSGNTANLTVSNNLTVDGQFTLSAGGTTAFDSLDITPATNIDALDITGTNITTADLIDLNATATTTGDAIDILMANTRTSGSAILITDESVAATVTGDLIQINVTGTPDTNTLDIDLSAAASGNLVDLTTTAVAFTGNYVDINIGSAAQTGDVFNVDIGALAVALQNMVVTNAAASTTAGWLMGVDASAAWTANAINFLQSAGISTGDVIAYDNTGNTATTGDFISFASGTGDADGDVFDITVELGATSTQIFDVNNAAVSDEVGWLMEVDTTGAWTGNAIDFTTGAQAWTGNVLDINFGNAAATGDVINIDNPALAVATQALVVTNAAASTTAGWLASVDASGAWTANAINFLQSAGISTGDVIAYDNTGNTATTGDFIAFASGTGDADGDVFDITIELGATSTQIFDVNNAAVSDEAGWLLEVDTTGAWTGNAIDFTTGAQAWTGNVLDINFGNAAATGDVINIDNPALAVATQALVVTNAAASSTAGWLASVDASGAWTANAINFLQSAGISTGDVIAYDNTGNTATTGDFISFASGTGDADGDVFDITIELGATSTQIFDVNNAAVSDEAGWLLEVDTTGAWTGNMVDITTGAQIWTGNMFDLNVGAAAATGDIINIDIGGSAPAVQALVVTGTSSTATGGVVSLAVDTAAGQSADIIDITSTLGIMDGSDTFQGIDINITGANHTGVSNVINGIAVDLTTPDADATETGILIGANWDVGLSSATPVSFGGSMDVSTQDTFTDSDATPDVSAGSHFITNTTAVTITDFDAGAGTLRTGQIIFVESNGAITYDVTASGLNGGTTDIITAAGDLTAWIYDGTDWNLIAFMDDSDNINTGVDLAEWFPASEEMTAGDVVSLDPTKSQYVKKSTGVYDSKLVGVVSTQPGLVLGEPAQGFANKIALVGRVPVKVTGENGAIAVGDYLTSSSTAGYAMKSTKPGPVVGMALESFDGESGTVIAFIKAAWFDPVEVQKQAVLAALGLGSGSVLGASTPSTSSGSAIGGTTTTTTSLVGPAADGSLGVLEEAADLTVYGLLTANNLKVTTAAEFAGTLVVKGLATFEGDLVVKGAFSTGSLDLSGALTKTMTAGSDLSAGDPVVVTGANTVARAGGPSANVVGLAASSASAGSSVKVAVAGTVGGYSGLSTGARYYVGSGGVVTTAPGGDKAVHIGIAVSGSEMIVQIFESAAPPAPAVVDVAEVDSGPTVSVSGDSTATTETSGSTTTEPTPSPTPTPTPVPSPEPSPSPTPVASPTPSPSPSPQP